jgi:hypothetical protein
MSHREALSAEERRFDWLLFSSSPFSTDEKSAHPRLVPSLLAELFNGRQAFPMMWEPKNPWNNHISDASKHPQAWDSGRWMGHALPLPQLFLDPRGRH